MICNSVWLGCDLSKTTFDVALSFSDVPEEDWQKAPRTCVPFSEEGVKTLLKWLKEHSVKPKELDGVCVESSGSLSWRFVELLNERLVPVSIINPKRSLDYARSLGIRDKSDWRDACILAQFGRVRRPKPKPEPSKAQGELKELSRTYAALQKERQANKQRLQEARNTCVKKELRALIKHLDTRLAHLAREMDARIQQDEQLRQDAKRAESIKGVGRKTTRVVLAEIGDLRRFKRDELVAYAGLYPSEFQSGSSVHRKSKMIKQGGARIRKVLYMCAMCARQHNPHMRAFAERLKAKGKCPMSILGAIMRKLLLLIYRVIVHEENYNEKHGLA